MPREGLKSCLISPMGYVILRIMAQSVLTSVRLTVPLKQQLENTAAKLHRGRNWVILEALKEYMDRHHTDFVEQVRQESLRAARQDHESQSWDQELWEQNLDIAGIE